MLLNGTRDRGWRVSLNQVDAGEFSASEMRLPGDITFRMHGRDEVVIHTIQGGRSRLDHGKASHRYRLGDVYVAGCPRVDFTGRTHEVRTRTITLPQSLLTEVANVTSATASPLVLGSAARLLAATALAVFPNTMVTELAGSPPTTAGLTASRRARPCGIDELRLLTCSLSV